MEPRFETKLVHRNAYVEVWWSPRVYSLMDSDFLYITRRDEKKIDQEAIDRVRTALGRDAKEVRKGTFDDITPCVFIKCNMKKVQRRFGESLSHILSEAVMGE